MKLNKNKIKMNVYLMKLIENIDLLNEMVDDEKVIVIDYMNGYKLMNVDKVKKSYVCIDENENECVYENVNEYLRNSFYVLVN